MCQEAQENEPNELCVFLGRNKQTRQAISELAQQDLNEPGNYTKALITIVFQYKDYDLIIWCFEDHGGQGSNCYSN